MIEIHSRFLGIVKGCSLRQMYDKKCIYFACRQLLKSGQEFFLIYRYCMMNTVERFTLGKNESLCGEVSCFFLWSNLLHLGTIGSQRTHDAIMTQWWRLHYVQTTSTTSFGRYEDVIIASCARWGGKPLTHLPLVPHIGVSESGQHWFR